MPASFNDLKTSSVSLEGYGRLSYLPVGAQNIACINSFFAILKLFTYVIRDKIVYSIVWVRSFSAAGYSRVFTKSSELCRKILFCRRFRYIRRTEQRNFLFVGRDRKIRIEIIQNRTIRRGFYSVKSFQISVFYRAFKRFVRVYRRDRVVYEA